MSNLYLRFVGALSVWIGRLDKYSEEQKEFLALGYVCLQCKKTLMSPWGFADVNCYSVSGEKIPLLKARASGEFAECPYCMYKWKLRSTSQATTTRK
jgi:DNA-directed RNA polymerase subunit RPC12/RpoP